MDGRFRPLARRAAPLAAWLSLATVLVSVSVLSFAGARPANLDDAFIVLVYARHLLSDLSLSWNAGDGPVEGFTSPLDLLVKAFALIASPADPIRATFRLNVALHAALPLLAAATAVLAAKGRPFATRFLAALAAGLLAATSPALAEGASFLLEAPLVAFTLTALAAYGGLAEAPRPWVLATLAILAAMARPEGLPLAAGLLALPALRPSGRQAALRGALLAGGTVALLFALRFVVFGEFVPNTYFAKSSTSRLLEARDGLSYVLTYVREGPPGSRFLPLLALLPALALAPGWSCSWARLRFALLSGLAVSSVGLIVLAGGDSYGGGRFLAGSLSLAFVALTFALADTTGLARGVALSVAMLVLAGPIEVSLREAEARRALIRDTWPVRHEHFECDRQIARSLEALLGTGTVAQSDYQKLKYFADGLRVVDLQGLNDRAIAHEPWPGPVRWGKYRHAHGVREAAPIWIFGYRTELHETPLADAGIERALTDEAVWSRHIGYAPEGADAEAIRRLYAAASLPVCGKYFDVLVRRDVAQELASKGLLVEPGAR